MPRPISVTLSGSSTSAPFYSTPWMPSHYANPFSIGIGVTTSSCLCMTYSVQHTFDPIFDDVIPGKTTVLASLATWIDHATLTGLSSDTSGSYISPVIGIRVAVTASSCLNSVTATFVQAGN